MSTRATKEALDLLAKYIEDMGPCEHAANICVCGEKQVVDDARAEVEAIEKAAKAIDIAHSGKPMAFSECDEWDNAVELMRTIAKGAK